MSDDANIAVVSRIWNEVWNQGKLEACDEIFAPDYVGIIPAQPGHPRNRAVQADGVHLSDRPPGRSPQGGRPVHVGRSDRGALGVARDEHRPR